MKAGEFGGRESAALEDIVARGDFRQVDRIDLNAVSLKLVERALHRFDNTGSAIIEEPVAESDAQTGNVGGLERFGKGEGMFGDQRVDRRKGDGGIGRGPGQRARGVEARAQGNDAVDRPAMDARLDADGPGNGSGDANRARRVAAEREDRGAGPQAHPGAGARATRRAVPFGVPRVERRAPMGVGADAAESEFDRMRLAGDCRQPVPQRGDHGSFRLPFLRQLLGRAGECRIARDAVKVLDRYGQSLKRTEVEFRGEGGVRDLRLGFQRFRLPGLVGLEGRVVFFVIFDHALGDAEGGDAARSQRVRQGLDRQFGEIRYSHEMSLVAGFRQSSWRWIGGPTPGRSVINP